jgi:CheY-like chemotaxis protein
MVHGLAAQSGGRLALKSRIGEGTTAEIWLPAISAKAATPAEPLMREDAVGTKSEIRSLGVLIVDDDALVLQNTAAMLEDLGHRVIEASSAREALEYLERATSVDLVITDQVMSGMTGLQLQQAIKQRWPHLRVILVTGYAELPSDLDCDLVRLNKPFRQHVLAQAIAESIQVTTAGRVVPFRPRLG